MKKIIYFLLNDLQKTPNFRIEWGMFYVDTIKYQPYLYAYKSNSH